MSKLSHMDEAGRARMVDVTEKDVTDRTASATGRVRCSAEAFAHAQSADSKKGDVRAVAELAGVMAAKRTADLIPLCHPLALSKIDVRVTPDAALPGFQVSATVRTTGRTGVEMEALTAVSVACLTVYDMLKAVDRAMVIDAISVSEKSGGRSGAYQRDA